MPATLSRGVRKLSEAKKYLKMDIYPYNEPYEQRVIVDIELEKVGPTGVR